MSEKKLKEANPEMDSKSFDDAELEDIMSEIEELEKDFATDDASPDLSEALGIEEGENVVAEDLGIEKENIKSTDLQDVIDQEVEEILDDAIASSEIDTEPSNPAPIVAEEVNSGPVLVEQEGPGASNISARDEALEAIESKIVAFESDEEQEKTESDRSVETKMDFAVSGQMKLNLNFEVAGQKIHLSVDEENGFLIEMDGGVRFSIPMDVRKAS